MVCVTHQYKGLAELKFVHFSPEHLGLDYRSVFHSFVHRTSGLSTSHYRISKIKDLGVLSWFTFDGKFHVRRALLLTPVSRPSFHLCPQGTSPTALCMSASCLSLHNTQLSSCTSTLSCKRELLSHMHTPKGSVSHRSMAVVV